MPRVSKIQTLGWIFLDFWNEFAQFLDFEAPARVSKNPNLGVDFFGCLELWKLEEFWSGAFPPPPFPGQTGIPVSVKGGGGGGDPIYIYTYTL